MNERIKELAEQATKHYPATESSGEFSTFDKEKFAELILQDIDKIVDALYQAMPLQQAAVLITLDENIKEHFYGVEQ